MVPRHNCIWGGRLSDKKETSAAIQKPQPSTVWRKRAADPEKFKPYIIVCVDSPCGQTYIWFMFLLMAIDHSDAWPSSNETETVCRSGTPYEVAFLYANFDLQNERELLRGGDGYARRDVCDIHVWVFTCYILWLNFAIYFLLLVCFAIPCKPSLLSSLVEVVYWENKHARLQTHSRLGTVERMSSLWGSYLTRALTFHPSSVSQAESALSVTDPLDSCDKDEDDIWTPTKGRGGRKMTNTRRAVKKLGGHELPYISVINFKSWLPC